MAKNGPYMVIYGHIWTIYGHLSSYMAIHGPYMSTNDGGFAGPPPPPHPLSCGVVKIEEGSSDVEGKGITRPPCGHVVCGKPWPKKESCKGL